MSKPPPRAVSLPALVPPPPSRRALLRGGLGLRFLALFAGCGDDEMGVDLAAAPGPLLGFGPVPISKADDVVVPAGYAWYVVSAWDDPVVAAARPFAQDASQPAAGQALQAGMFHDGMELFPLARPGAEAGAKAPSKGPERALLAINYESCATATDGAS